MNGNLWDFASLDENHIACITTNGFVKKNGECVMGRGCAQEAKNKFKGLATALGDRIERYGNRVHTFCKDEFGQNIITFPTKHVWWKPSDLELIKKSADELRMLATAQPNVIFYLPRPGCGNGQLKWSDVRPVIEGILPDNVVIVDYKQASGRP